MTNNKHQLWQFWVDRGGTFTDIIGHYQGKQHSLKLLSDNPEQYQDSVIAGMRALMRQQQQDFDVSKIDSLKLGTTLTTNALLEHKGARVLLITTKGFADLASIGYQNRSDIFALEIKKPETLYAQVVTIDERISAEGSILTSLNQAHLQKALPHALLEQFDSVAVCLMHAYLNPEHELKVADYLKQQDLQHISLSHQVSPQIRMVPRLDTTLINAYLSPLLNQYTEQLSKHLPGVAIHFMQSSGGLINPKQLKAANSIMSGPAAGVVGMVETAKRLGFQQIIGFDMGGTSTDICVFDKTYQYSQQKQLAGYRVRAPMLDIHTIASGGGSLLTYQDQRFQVGPESAGAMPGPCSYGNLGPLTITDAQVHLGRIQAELFPNMFGPDADQPLDTHAASHAFKKLAKKISKQQQKDWSSTEVAQGFIEIAVAQMANTIERLCAERGLNIQNFILNCFGGAAGQLACDLAKRLQLKQFMLHPDASVLSALGIGQAQQQVLQTSSFRKALQATSYDLLIKQFEALAQQAKAQLDSTAVINLSYYLSLAYKGSEQAIEFELPDDNEQSFQKQLEHGFHQSFQERYGYQQLDSVIQIQQLTCKALTQSEFKATKESDQPSSATPSKQTAGDARFSSYQVLTGSGWQAVPFISWQDLSSGSELIGPAVVYNHQTSFLLDCNWQLNVQSEGELLVSSLENILQMNNAKVDSAPDPVTLELMNNLFQHIAQQMGEQLRRTAISVNIKERLDFSCALFDSTGQLIANAPHMPVHLGSMGSAVKQLLQADIELTPGSAFMSNDPYAGGTHLPDITVITPAFDKGKLSFFVASRGHHADIGGITPGSMPAHSTHIREEGIRFENLQIVKQQDFAEQSIIKHLTSGPYPARNVKQCIMDLKAQLAANAKGIQLMNKAADQYGMAQIQRYFGFCLDNAEQAMQRTLNRLASGSFSYPMDNGAKIQVRVNIDKAKQTASIDFTGSSAVQDSNFNAPEAITRAAVLYVMRCMIGENIPLNDGCLRPIEIKLPKPSMLAPAYPAAVVAGNVETSQAITDALFGALGALAGSAGTMTNLSFGNKDFQYYETIAGGSGAGPSFNGCSGVQTHMTNSRITDPEILESRFPVRLLEYGYRGSSSGKGLFCGGEGIVRRFEFLEPCEVNLLAGNHQCQPFGLEGGTSGQSGSVKLIAHGNNCHNSCETIFETIHQATCRITITAGDQLEIKTPGGGGYHSST